MARKRPGRGGRGGAGRPERPPQQRYESVKAHWASLSSDRRRRLLTVPVKRLARGAPCPAPLPAASRAACSACLDQPPRAPSVQAELALKAVLCPHHVGLTLDQQRLGSPLHRSSTSGAAAPPLVRSHGPRDCQLQQLVPGAASAGGVPAGLRV